MPGEEVCFSLKGEYYSQRPLEGGNSAIRYSAILLATGKKKEERKWERKIRRKGEGEIRFLPGRWSFRYRVHCVVFDPAYRAVEKEEEVQVLMESLSFLQPRFTSAKQEKL